jgi:hypothetical protein
VVEDDLSVKRRQNFFGMICPPFLFLIESC